MNRFYLDKLIVAGGGHEPSVIDFGKGVNFILGPSNTGKTLIMDCLDYMFGFTPKKGRPSKIVDNNHGYEKIELHLITDNGTVVLERIIGDTKIKVSGSDLTVEPGDYSVDHKAKKSINSVFLHLIGIDEVHSIRSAVKGSKTQDLTWRSMLHLFFLRQADVAREQSALIAPNSMGTTVSEAVLLFLLTGQDANELLMEIDPKIGEAKKEAIVSYIKDKVSEYAKRRETLEESMSALTVSDTKISIEYLQKQIAELKTKMESATKESKNIMSQIYEWNGKLSESRIIEHNFSVLYQQYQSDIRRIGFVIDGASNVSLKNSKVKCPVCGEETEHLHNVDFINSSSAELEKIKTHLVELNDAQNSLKKQQEEILSKIQILEEKKNEINKLITEQLQPQLSMFENNLDKQMRYVRIVSELDIVKQSEEQYRTELFKESTKEIAKPTEHKISEDFKYEVINGFEKKLIDILKASRVGGGSSAVFNMDIFDVEIDGKKKSVSMGGGFCGILNTIVTLAMSGYLIDIDRNAPSFYAVDSSLTQLSEAGHKEQKETIKLNFVNYLINHAHERQVIIVEQTDRMPFVPIENADKNIHVIQFTRNRDKDRYGFLNDVYNQEDV